MINPDKIYNIVKNYDYVSFDVFDTLVKRNVAEPEDVFSIIEKMVGGSFRKRRIYAECKARDKIRSKSNSKSVVFQKEVTLSDIYSYMDYEKRDALQKLEIEIEYMLATPNIPMLDVYNRCIEDGKRVYLISDMYLSKDVVERILKKCGINVYNELFLSSDRQKLKSDGTLYRDFLKEGIKPSQVIHIGDTFGADYVQPKKLGIAAVRIPRYINNVSTANKKVSIEYNYYNSFINNTIGNVEDEYYRVGYAKLGGLLYGFCNWCYKEAKKNNIDKLFFLSRDGYVLKQVYDICFPDSDIKSYYLEISRRSVKVPLLWKSSSYNELLDTICVRRKMSLRAVFDSIGLEIDSYTDEIRKCNLEVDTCFYKNNIHRNLKLKRLLESVKPDIIANSRKEYDRLLEYMNKHSVSGRVGIIDVGYYGTVQRYLSKCLDSAGIMCDMIGLYLVGGSSNKDGTIINSYLLDTVSYDDIIATVKSFSGILEILFNEYDGSVKKYVYGKNGIITQRYLNEYSSEGNSVYNNLESLRSGALDFARNASKDKMMHRLQCKPREYFLGIYKLCATPSLKEVKMFGDMPIFELGDVKKLAQPRNMLYYLMHPVNMISDFDDSDWKVGFLKRLFILELPYFKLFFIVKKYFRR